jgi:hypothetical protein
MHFLFNLLAVPRHALLWPSREKERRKCMFPRCFISQCLWVHIPLLVRVRSNGVGGSTASSAVVCARMYVCMYGEAHAYGIATLWQSLKAIGTELS